MRLPSGWRFHGRALALDMIDRSVHGRGLLALNESPSTVYDTTMIRLSTVRYRSSGRVRDHTGSVPLSVETSH